MTELLYMQDFDVESCTAAIVSIVPALDGRTDIVLDKTCFYARGGGQDWDRGDIKHGANSFSVEEVHVDENGIVHHLGNVTGGTFNIGDVVVGLVDKDRRSTNTRLHSAGHVIDMAIDSLGLDWIATKGQHYPHLSAVEYSGTWESNTSDELRLAIERRTNELIGKGTENRLAFMSAEKMHTVCRHVPANIPRNKPGRVIIYGDNFGIPCGGTHVRNLSQVGTVSVPKLKQKKGVIRVNYEVEGTRA